jgi:dienelactone hydrolase
VQPPHPDRNAELAMAKVTHWIDSFPDSFKYSNATLVCKGLAPYGAVAIGEIDAITDRIAARGDDPNAWIEEWSAMAEKLETEANAAAAAGHQHTAGNFFLRAGFYHYTGERFLPPGEEKRRHYLKSLHCCQEGLRRRHPQIEFVEVPYEKTTLPAYFLRAQGASGAAPTVVVFDGMDNCKEMSILFCGLEFSRRSMNVLSIDGPGQGEALRARGIHSRYDYEVAGTAAYEYVARRKEVDAARVAVLGYSFGGYQVPRICAFEKRYAAGVAFGAMHWDIAAWVEQIYRDNRSNPKGSFSTPFQFQWVVGARSEEEALAIARKFSLEGVCARVQCPFLTVHGEEDRVVAVDSAHKLHAALGTQRKTLKIFSRAEGAAEHVQVDDRQRGVDYIADWLADNL